MGVDKRGVKGGGFFHLFDRNKKARKKLLSDGSASLEVAKQGKQFGVTLPPAELASVFDGEEIVGASSMKGSKDYRCASSVIDEEGNGTRAPGVVARLMGLDSMPASGVSEPYPTPLYNSRSLLDNCSQERCPEFYINDRSNRVSSRVEGCSRRTPELRSQKMPSSLIKRFQTEALPLKSARSLPIPRHRLLSLIKNPGFVSTQNAAHIMETAAKILEPELRSSIESKIRDSKKSMVAPQRTLRLTGSSRRPVESTAMRSLTKRYWNGSEDTTVSRYYLDTDETNPAGEKGKRKSNSLAVQAKVNVQRREDLSTCSRNTLVQKDHHECKLNQPFKSQPNNQKNEQQKKASTTNASGVLRQDNQRQDCSRSKDKFPSKPSIYNQQGRKVPSRDVSSGKTKTVNKLSRSYNVGYRKECSAIAYPEKEGLSSSNKNFPRKKRVTEGGISYEKSGSNDNILVDRHERHVHHNVVIDEQSRWTEDNRKNGTDIISFSFTSPMIKPIHGSQLSFLSVEKWDKRHGYCFDTQRKTALDANSENLSSLGLNVIGGDALGLPLEQKLRKLPSGIESSYSNLVKVGSDATSPIMQASVSASDTPGSPPAEDEKEEFRSCIDELGVLLYSGSSSTDGQVLGMSHKLLEVESLECSSSRDAQKEPGHYHQSPLSVLETTFSNESCNSSESWGSAEGNKMCSSSIQAQYIFSSNGTNKIPSAEAANELSDSASSAFTETADEEHALEISRTDNAKACRQELEYLREILSNIEPMFKDIGSCHVVQARDILDPLLFDKLEYRKIDLITHEGEDKESKVRRKVLFDCLNECMDQKRSRYFRAGYRAWAKGMAIVGKEMADELYKEIAEWNSMGDWMVDELLDKDMSSHLGRWIDFQTEAFEAGVEIESGIFSALVDEVAADFLIEGQCM